MPGVLDILFPRLSGGLVNVLNARAVEFPEINPVPSRLINSTSIPRAMLFEMSSVYAEQILHGATELKWSDCLDEAVERQRRHYDAKAPEQLLEVDRKAAEWAAENLINMLKFIEKDHTGLGLVQSPQIPGYGWIATGRGDYSVGCTLIEVKHAEKNFVASDYRQVLLYWLLKYASCVESDDDVWSRCVLLNPRKNLAVSVSFDYLLRSASANATRVELYELLRSIVGDDPERRT